MDNNEEQKNQKFHEYDGIIEHNNPMPGWWIWTFMFTVMFAFLYYLHYEVADGPTLKDELAVSMTEIEKIRNASGGSSAAFSEADILKVVSDPNLLMQGAAVFVAKCAVCHGDNLQGKIGPNLTDKFWIHGDGKPVTISEVIKTGVPAKGMPPWNGILKSDEIIQVTGYILSKKNSKPSEAKPSEGTEITNYF